MSELTQAFNENNPTSIYFSGIIETFRKLSMAEFETIGIVFNHDQFEAILGSLNEIREGKVVSLKEAFSDL